MAKKVNPALMKPYKLTPELEMVVGKGPMSRGQVVKKIWEYIKKGNMQNPQNKRNIIADDKLKVLFDGKKEVEDWLLKEQMHKKVMVCASDTFRAAAVDQLTIWAERIGVEIIKHKMGADPGAVAYDACEAAKSRGADVLIVDTAGRLHTQDHLMRELTKIRDVVAKRIPGAPHEALLVLDATTGQNAILQAKNFGQAVGITGIMLAKLDGTAKGGMVMAIRDQLNIPVKFIGLGETPQDIETIDPKRFIEAMFGGGE